MRANSSSEINSLGPAITKGLEPATNPRPEAARFTKAVAVGSVPVPVTVLEPAVYEGAQAPPDT